MFRMLPNDACGRMIMDRRLWAMQGHQSVPVADQATGLHAGGSRMKAIQGSIGTQDRHNQGKRDSR